MLLYFRLTFFKSIKKYLYIDIIKKILFKFYEFGLFLIDIPNKYRSSIQRNCSKYFLIILNIFLYFVFS